MAGAVWGWNPSTLSLVLQVLLLVGIVIAVLQLRAAERARKVTLFFKLLESYDTKEMYDGVRLLSGKQYRTLNEFNTAFADKLEEAHVARRKVKTILASYGYMLKFKIAKRREIFPIIPAAIENWGNGLREVEAELLTTTHRERENALGYDLVSLANYLHNKYQQDVNGKSARLSVSRQ